jgi:flavin reductase (DIM6/NTAB) family NADH-FMN oxidoreductase RutF
LAWEFGGGSSAPQIFENGLARPGSNFVPRFPVSSKEISTLAASRNLRSSTLPSILARRLSVIEGFVELQWLRVGLAGGSTSLFIDGIAVYVRGTSYIGIEVRLTSFAGQSKRHASTKPTPLSSTASCWSTAPSLRTSPLRFSSTAALAHDEQCPAEELESANVEGAKKIREQSPSQEQEKAGIEGSRQVQRKPPTQSNKNSGNETGSTTLIRPNEVTLHLEKVAEQTRDLMRDMVHPIVVITSCSADATWPFPISARQTSYLSPYYRNFCAATVSSFTTVTLGPPYPAVSFNLKRPSRTLSGILKHKHFRVVVLNGDESGAAVASAFIRGHQPQGFEELAANKHWVGLKSNAGWLDKKGNWTFAPDLVGPGVRGSFECRIFSEKCVEVGDHTIVVGVVRSVSDSTLPSGDSPSPEYLPALSYSKRRFRGEAQMLTPLSDQADAWQKEPGQIGTAHTDDSLLSQSNEFREIVRTVNHMINLDQDDYRLFNSLFTAALNRAGYSANRAEITSVATYLHVWHRLLRGEKIGKSFVIEVSPTILRIKNMLVEGVHYKEILERLNREDEHKPPKGDFHPRLRKVLNTLQTERAEEP